MLGANLDKYGVPEDEIMKNVKMFERYLNSLTPEEYAKEAENIDIDAISENILKLIEKKAQKSIQTEIRPSNELPTRTMKLVPVEYEQVRKLPPPIDLDSLDEIPVDELPKVKGTPAFWAIFFLTLPITIPIIAIIFAIFFVVIASMAVLIVGLIVSLIGIVAAGSALALVGIVYGVTQTFSTLPIGLYEIGLGILIGGTAMFSGIIVYNIAVRFLPFAIRYVIRFMKYSAKRIKYLFYYLKKESAVR